jgi:hypothetical protein
MSNEVLTLACGVLVVLVITLCIHAILQDATIDKLMKNQLDQNTVNTEVIGLFDNMGKQLDNHWRYMQITDKQLSIMHRMIEQKADKGNVS